MGEASWLEVKKTLHVNSKEKNNLQQNLTKSLNAGSDRTRVYFSHLFSMNAT